MNDTGLFRTHAIESQKNRLHGNVMLLPRLSHTLLTLIIFAWVCAGLIWLVNGQYARKETVTGWLEPKEGEIKVYSSSAKGEVSNVLVSEGQQVVKGQTLIIINGARYMQKGMSLESQLYKNLEQQNNLLLSQQKRLSFIHQQSMGEARLQLASTEQNLSRLSKQIDVLKTRIKMKWTRVQQLKQVSDAGHVAKLELENSIEHHLNLESDLQQFFREKISLQESLKLIESSLALMPKQHLNQMDDLVQKRSAISQKMLELDSQRSQTVRAPISGTVANLKALSGKKPSPSTPLMTILPENPEVEANLLVPVRAVGFLRAGQKIEIRYDAYPYQKFGLHTGNVRLVSDSVSLPAELGPVPVQTQEPVYLVKAKLNSDTVLAYGQRLKLKSGMTLNADIKLGKRTLLEWLLEPFISLRGRV